MVLTPNPYSYSSANYIIPENFYFSVPLFVFAAAATASHILDRLHFHLTAIVIDFPLNASNYEWTFPFCRKTLLKIAQPTQCKKHKRCFRRWALVRMYAVRRVRLWSAGRSCDCYYYVRYQTINIIGYQNYTSTWWWHSLLPMCILAVSQSLSFHFFYLISFHMVTH